MAGNGANVGSGVTWGSTALVLSTALVAATGFPEWPRIDHPKKNAPRLAAVIHAFSSVRNGLFFILSFVIFKKAGQPCGDHAI